LLAAMNSAAMEIFEAIAWVALGFAPTMAAMEAAWKISRRKLAPIEVGIRR
jgi:hypothetical protein